MTQNALSEPVNAERKAYHELIVSPGKFTRINGKNGKNDEKAEHAKREYSSERNA